MDKTRLEEDLRKLEKVSKLNLSGERLGGFTQGSEQSIDRPLRILFYFESKIDVSVREGLLQRYSLAWDIILIIQHNELLLNRKLPAVNAFDVSKSRRWGNTFLGRR